MSFVASTSQAVSANGTIPIPKFLDASGLNWPSTLYSHLYLQNTVAAGSISGVFDSRSSSPFSVNGLGSLSVAIPSNANNVVITIGGGGSGSVSFGKDT